MSIQDKVKAAVKDAMRSKDRTSLQTLRLVSAAFKQIEVDQRLEITDEIAIVEMVRQVKQRQDAARQYHAAGREELAAHEKAEIAIIEQFLPEQMSQEEMHVHVDRVIGDSGLPLAIASMGKLMPVLKRELQGRTDMTEVSKYLRQKLSPS